MCVCERERGREGGRERERERERREKRREEKRGGEREEIIICLRFINIIAVVTHCMCDFKVLLTG